MKPGASRFQLHHARGAFGLRCAPALPPRYARGIGGPSLPLGEAASLPGFATGVLPTARHSPPLILRFRGLWRGARGRNRIRRGGGPRSYPLCRLWAPQSPAIGNDEFRGTQSLSGCDRLDCWRSAGLSALPRGSARRKGLWRKTEPGALTGIIAQASHPTKRASLASPGTTR